MNKHFTQITEVILPVHDEDDSCTTLRVFDVDEYMCGVIHEVGYENDANYYDEFEVAKFIKGCLDVWDDYGVMPGAPYHRFEAEFNYPHTVMLWDTLAYDI